MPEQLVLPSLWVAEGGCRSAASPLGSWFAAVWVLCDLLQASGPVLLSPVFLTLQECLSRPNVQVCFPGLS